MRRDVAGERASYVPIFVYSHASQTGVAVFAELQASAAHANSKVPTQRQWLVMAMSKVVSMSPSL
jgi:hypothetical protein